jgi:membrane-bound lytic murein transglycosylase D
MRLLKLQQKIVKGFLKLMFKIIIVILLSVTLLFANFNFNDNYEKQLMILKKFDVGGSFLNNQFLKEMILKYRSENRQLLFFKAMSNAVLFLPTIKGIISKSKIPKEFLYLAMAESELISVARSKKQAAGIWQFMPTTAKIYGLQVNDFIDERLDMIRSTEVAVEFLENMYKKFGKWYLAALAYNCGEGTLTKAIAKAGTDDLEVLIRPNKKYLPKESRIYIRKILALALMEGSDDIFASKYAYIFNVGNNSSLARVKIGGGESLEEIAKMINMDYQELKGLNSHILFGITPITNSKKKYNLYIPNFKLPIFKKNYRVIKHKISFFEYIVQQGDSLYQIGLKYGCNYKKLKELNKLSSDTLFTGQKLLIPITLKKKKKAEPVLTNINTGIKYVVKKGDTLFSIARNFNIDVKILMELNNLQSSKIYIGESLIVK